MKKTNSSPRLGLNLPPRLSKRQAKNVHLIKKTYEKKPKCRPKDKPAKLADTGKQPASVVYNAFTEKKLLH